MTGNSLLAQFDRIMADDLYGLAVDEPSKLSFLNTAASDLMQMCAIRSKNVPLLFNPAVSVYPLANLTIPLVYVDRVKLQGVDIMKSDEGTTRSWTADEANIYLYYQGGLMGTIFTVDGHLAPPVITATDTQIGIIPEQIQQMIPVQAVVNSLGPFQTTPEQNLKVSAMMGQVRSRVRDYQSASIRNSFPDFTPRYR